MTYSKQALDFARAELETYQQSLVKEPRRTLYDRDIKWLWGKYKNVPLSCIPLEYFAWFVQQSRDKLWLGRIEKEMLCRQNGDKVMNSKTKFNTPKKVQDELDSHAQQQQALKKWKNDPRVGDWLKTKEPVKSYKKLAKQQQNKTITKNTNTTTGSYTIPTHNFDGSPVDFSTPPF